MIRIGTAGWNIPKAFATVFATDGKHLERYARVLPCVEINSSFYRPHRTTTYRRWADETPDGFRFSVKLPRAITHDARLADVHEPLDRFFAEAGGLGEKLGLVLVQLPPSLPFDVALADAFWAALGQRHRGAVVCEPRHASWFTPEADAALKTRRVARAAADPAKNDAASRPGGWLGGTIYYRWHGSPRIYRSAYADDWLAARAEEVKGWPAKRDVWCVFDNTAAGAATDDALRLQRLVGAGRR